ncbi:MAG: hypothetical protein N3D20_00885 [Candidatus Pacearchaeota archaeon]|nr:hypothetical protein [Candidatus Pacearchaeota archaeon]
MANWIIILLIVMVALIILIKFKEIRHKILYLALAIIITLFVFSFGYIYFKSNSSISTYEGFIQVGKIYLNWLSNIGKNFGTITSYAIKQDWGLNLSNFSIK